MTVFPPLNGSLFSDPVLVYPLRLSSDLINSQTVYLQRFFLWYFWGSFTDLSNEIFDFTGSRLHGLQDGGDTRLWSCKNLKHRETVFLPLTPWSWISRWLILGLGVHICTLWVNLHTQDAPDIGHQSPTVWRLHSSVVLTCSPWNTCFGQWTAGGIGSVSFPSSGVFRSFEGFCWFDYGESVGYADFNPPGPFISVTHTSSSFHPFTSFHTVFNSFPRTFSSVSSLNGTSWWYILAFHCL